MALVHNDKIKEAWPEQFFIVLFIIVADQLLIQSEIHLVARDLGRVFLLVVDLMDCLCKGLEVLFYGLIDKNVPVSEIQDFAFQAGTQQTVYDLESCISLPRSRRHHEKDTILTQCDGIKGSIDCDTLIVSRWVSILG